jgi:hypothetical protein
MLNSFEGGKGDGSRFQGFPKVFPDRREGGMRILVSVARRSVVTKILEPWGPQRCTERRCISTSSLPSARYAPALMTPVPFSRVTPPRQVRLRSELLSLSSMQRLIGEISKDTTGLRPTALPLGSQGGSPSRNSSMRAEPRLSTASGRARRCTALCGASAARRGKPVFEAMAHNPVCCHFVPHFGFNSWCLTVKRKRS